MKGDVAVSQAPPRTADPRPVRNPVGLVVRTLAGVFLVAGVLGFVPGVTADDETLAFAGQESTALLFGIFRVSVLHNVIHLLLGVFGLAMALPVRAAVVFLFWGGASQLLLWAYGIVINLDSAANFVPFNTADNWLHLFLGVGMTVLAVAIGHNNRKSVTAVSPGEETR